MITLKCHCGFSCDQLATMLAHDRGLYGVVDLRDQTRRWRNECVKKQYPQPFYLADVVTVFGRPRPHGLIDRTR